MQPSFLLAGTSSECLNWLFTEHSLPCSATLQHNYAEHSFISHWPRHCLWANFLLAHRQSVACGGRCSPQSVGLFVSVYSICPPASAYMVGGGITLWANTLLWRVAQLLLCRHTHILGFLFLSNFSVLKHLSKFNHRTFYGNLTADFLQWRKKIAILSMTAPPVGLLWNNPGILSLERLSQVNQPDTHRIRISIFFWGKFGSWLRLFKCCGKTVLRQPGAARRAF